MDDLTWNYPVVRNGRGLLGFETLKSAVSPGPFDEMSWFFVHQYKFGKAKSYFNNGGMVAWWKIKCISQMI